MATGQQASSSSGQGDRFLWSCLGIFSLALAVRVLHLWQIRGAVFFELKMGDARAFDVWARQIAAGDWLGDAVFYQAPLYPYLLGAIYALLGDDAIVVRGCQAVLGASSCVLLALAGRRFFSRSAGVAAGLILAFYAPAIFTDGLIQKSVLGLFLLCALLWLLGEVVRRPRGHLWLWLGVATGLLALTRENALLFAPLILVWLFLQYRDRGKQRLVFALLFCLGIGIVMLPVAARNRIVGGEFHLSTYNFGINFYIGNNRNSSGLYTPLRPGRGNVDEERHDATALAERALGRKLTAGEVSQYWTRLALHDIASDPARWIRLVARKLFMTWNAEEIGDTEGQQSHAEWSAPLRWTGRLFHFGVLAPLALFGAWVTWQDRRRLWLLYLMAAGYAASVAMFYVFARYRLSLVPFLALFAAVGLTQAPRFWRERSMPRVAAAVTATLVAALLCNWPMSGLEDQSWLRFYNWGTALQSEGRQQEAIPYLRRSVELSPDNPYARNNLAVALESQGELPEAIAHLRHAVRVDGDFADGHKNLGSALAESGRRDEALRHLREAARLEPESPEPLNNAAWYLATDPASSPRERDEAIRLAKRAAALTAGDNPTVLDTLAAAYAAAGRFEDALTTAERALIAARREGDSPFAAEIRQRVELYRHGRPYQRRSPARGSEAQR
jgi:tetratricopeptide (TPR) repeat protein